MEILAHRGYWNQRIQANSKEAFESAFAKGYGIETDLRDHAGQVVIAHDMAGKYASLMRLDEFLSLYPQQGKDVWLALNIKADGLQEGVQSSLKKYGVKHYFLFDMAVPDAILYSKLGETQLFTRHSEYETVPSFYDEAVGVWMDEFKGPWITKEVLESHAKAGKKVAIVSPELHRRDDYEARWEAYKAMGLHQMEGAMLCTDYPDEARAFFA